MEDDENQRVYLNVGGTVFETCRDTLMSTGSSYFTKRLRTYDSTTFLFIDREPTLFIVILNYLRTRQCITVDMPKSFAEMVMTEATYFDLIDLQNQLARCLTEKKKNDNELVNEIKLFRLSLQPRKPRSSHEERE